MDIGGDIKRREIAVYIETYSYVVHLDTYLHICEFIHTDTQFTSCKTNIVGLQLSSNIANALYLQQGTR